MKVLEQTSHHEAAARKSDQNATVGPLPATAAKFK